MVPEDRRTGLITQGVSGQRSRMFNFTTAKRVCAVLILAIIFFFTGPGAAEAYAVRSETLFEEPVTAGVTLKKFFQETGDGPLRVYVLVVDLRHPYVRLETLIGADNRSFGNTLTVREMAERSGAVAALNGDFFHLSEGKHPLGMTVREGEFLTSPMRRGDYYSFALLQDGRPVIDLFRFSGEVVAPNGLSFYPLGGINKPAYQAVIDGKPVNSDLDSLQMYTPAWGPTSRGATPELPGIVEMVVAGGVVREIRINQPGVAIPPDGYILRAHGVAVAFLLDNFRVGDPVTVRYQVEPYGKEVRTAVGGQALLVENGRRVEPFSQNIKGRAARSAIGISREGGTLYLVGVEQSSESRGVTQEELADFLVERLGVWRALNLDGGGSTSLVARPLGEFKPVPVNTPAKGAERRVPDALGIFSTAPPGELAGLVVRGPDEILAGLPYRYKVGGYDTYFNPYTINASDVVWQVEQGSGGFEGDVLTARSGGTLVIAAKIGGVMGKLSLKVLGTEDMAVLEVTPAHIAVEPGGQVKLSVQVRGKDGRTWPLSPRYVNWTVQGDAGEVREGVFCARNEVAAGVVVARFGGLEASVPVEVAPSGQRFLWIGPEGAEAREGKFDVRVAPGAFAARTAVGVKNVTTAADLPAGYLFLDGLSLQPYKPPAAGTGCLLRWTPNGQDAGRIVFFHRGADGTWLPQPTTGGGSGPVLGRVEGFGEIVVALREEEVVEPGDTASHWSRPAVLQLIMRGAVQGFPDGTFRPEAAVTRAQFAVIIANAFGWAEPGDVPLSFRDRVPSWAVPGVKAAVARGIIAGYPDGRFLPDKPITRAEMAVLVDRALGLKDGESPVFQDEGKIPGWALAAVRRTAAAGVVQGAGGYFRPLATATRGETAALIAKALAYYTRW